MTDIFNKGKVKRQTQSTAMNTNSSRSHMIFSVMVNISENGKDTLVGKLNLVDLAGSERSSKTGSTGERLREANGINSSLLALGIWMKDLAEEKETFH